MRNFRARLFTPRRSLGPAWLAGSRPGAELKDEFSRLILPHLDGAYNLARYLTRDATLSEDIVQEAVLRALRSFAQFRGGSPRAWFFTILRNCCRTVQSGSISMTLVVNASSLGEDATAQLATHADEAPTPEEAMASKEDIALVRAAIEAIPEPFREAVVLRDIEELSYAEIAHVTAVPIGTVMSRLSRGRALLAGQLMPAAGSGEQQSRSAK